MANSAWLSLAQHKPSYLLSVDIKGLQALLVFSLLNIRMFGSHYRYLRYQSSLCHIHHRLGIADMPHISSNLKEGQEPLRMPSLGTSFTGGLQIFRRPVCNINSCAQVSLGSCVEVESDEHPGHQMIALVTELFQDPEVRSHSSNLGKQQG